MKNRSHGYDIKRNLGVDMDANILNIKYDLAMMVIVCTKQHITNIWSSVCERVKLRKLTKELSWVWKKRVNGKKKADIYLAPCVFHFVGIIYLVEVLCINESKWKNSILNRLKYKKIKRCYSAPLKHLSCLTFLTTIFINANKICFTR